MAGRRWLFIVVAGAAIALLVGRVIAGIYTEYLWYAALGANDVWAAKYETLIALRVMCSTAATLFVFANLYAVRQSVVSLVLPRRVGNLDIGEEVPRRHLTWVAAALSLIIGVSLAWVQSDWSAVLAARIGLPFGESDPYFATDLGFFVYRLPVELSLFMWTVTVVLVAIGLVVLLYALTPSLRWEQGTLYVSGYVRRHLAMLAGILLLVLAWHYRLEMYTVLGEGSSGDGFGYLDHRVVVPANLLLSLVTLGAGLTVVWAGWSGQMRLAFAALTGVLVAALSARQVAPFIARRATADRDPAARDRPYEATRAGYTRRAFAVDRITGADSTVRFNTLGDAAPYVSVWDEGALHRASERALAGTAVGWTTSDSGLIAFLPTLAGGGSVAMFAASTSEESGTPMRLARPSGETPPMLIVTDSTARALLVADSSGRVNAPSLSGSGVRLAHALSMQDFRIWFGDLPDPMPKLLTHRTVRDRVRMLAPFFAQGSTISPVWFADSLAWTLELYSASDSYPLSRRVSIAGSTYAYYQHAATALVNAATGRTVLITDSLPDPVALTWMGRFPRLFVRATSLPAAVRRQLPPARDGARAQAIAFGRFGTRTETDVVRQLAPDDGADSALVSSPPPLTGFPAAGTTGLVMPLVDANRNYRGSVIALGGAGHRTVWLPATRSDRGWDEALDSLRAADTVGASLLVRGYVRAVPVRSEVVLLQPRYDWRGGGAPRLLYIAALTGDSVRSDRSLARLAGRAAEPALTAADFRARVRELYDDMRRASARGDFAAFGRALDALGVLLRSRRESP
ncbi:MAG TPA: UPF0182 family protein [Gemmatimonadaceae bacterium]|nr:UPF0182 family protein [Gemmatimonadaceae bacterium]